MLDVIRSHSVISRETRGAVFTTLTLLLAFSSCLHFENGPEEKVEVIFILSPVS